MNDQTMHDTLAADRDAVIAQVNAELAQHLPYWPTAVVTHVVDAMTTIGWRKVPDRDEAIRRIADAIVRNSSSIGSRDSARRHATTAYDALFGSLAAGEATP